MIHPLDIILAIIVAFLAREWFILGWPGEATERAETGLDPGPQGLFGERLADSTSRDVLARSAASPVHTLGAASTSQQHGLTADKAGRTDNLEGDAV